jgi:hypothetical protein
MGRLGLLIGAAALCAVASCGSSLPTPRAGTPPAQNREYVDVAYPPPAAQVEVVPPSPEPGAVWVDGEWSWQGKRWAWEPGCWVLAPQKDAYYAGWTIAVRPEDGMMRYSPGSWHAANGTSLPKPRILLAAEPGSAAAAPQARP